MNLIEQLGGYGEAKGLFNLYEYSISFRYYKDFEGDFESAGYVDVFIPDLQKALLEYRRQHNIFEVGDSFVNYADDAIYTALSIDQNNRMHGKSGDKNVWTYFGRFGLRHATDEEIKAGKRLEVS